uniref:Uncharacterized protein n=1 Tax=Ananas comosus var. bracteatus TaxID=296719 RepID=A0A6V7NWM4_ANACO|nr:unnamed protein product [Ananas comosus var. bracteatus]
MAVGLSFGAQFSDMAVGLSFGAQFSDMAVGLSFGAQFSDMAVGLSFGAQFSDMAVGLSFGTQFTDISVVLSSDAQFSDMAVGLSFGAQFNDMTVGLSLGAQFNDMAVGLSFGAQFSDMAFNDMAVGLMWAAQFNDMVVGLSFGAQFNDMAVGLSLGAQFNDMAVGLMWAAQFNDMAVDWMFVNIDLFCLREAIEIVALIDPKTDGQSERTILTLEDMLRACVLDFGGGWYRHLRLVEFANNNSYQASIQMAPFEALYGRRCRSPLFWSDVGERRTLGPEILIEAEEKSHRPGGFADLEYVKAQSTFCRPFRGKYVFDPSHVIDFTPLEIGEDLSYEERPVRILARKSRELRNRVIPFVKVQWSNHEEREATSEPETVMRESYPYLFEALD